MLNKLKNKYESQKISKKFKNKHRRNALNPKSLINRKRKKYAKNWCKKCQTKNCKYGTKKELKRLKKLHFRDCECSLKHNDINKYNDLPLKEKKYPNIINPFDDFDIFGGNILDFWCISWDKYPHALSEKFKYSSSSCRNYEYIEHGIMIFDDLYDFEQEYEWKCSYSQKKNKYLSQKIDKKFKNKHKNHKYKKYITRRKRKRINSSKSKTKKLKNVNITQQINHNIKKEIYDYQQLYDALDNIQEFNDTEVTQQQYEDEKIDLLIDFRNNKEKSNIKQIELTLKLSLYSSSWNIYDLLPLEYIINKIKINKLSSESYCAPFTGHIIFNEMRSGGFIVFDDLDINRKYCWNKKINFDCKDCDFYYHNFHGNERVLFDIKIDNLFNNINQYPSWSIDTNLLKAINIRLPKINTSMTNDDINLLISGYLSKYFKHYDMYLPKDIQQIIIWYYNQYENNQMKANSNCDAEYYINNFIMNHKNPPSTHNIIISEIGLKNDMNKTYQFTFKVLKKPISGYFGIGIISHAQNVINYLNKYKNKRPWWWGEENTAATDNTVFTENLNLNNGDLFCLYIKLHGIICSLKLEKNYTIIDEMEFIIFDNDIYFPYVGFGNGITAKDNSVKLEFHKLVTIEKFNNSDPNNEIIDNIPDLTTSKTNDDDMSSYQELLLSPNADNNNNNNPTTVYI